VGGPVKEIGREGLGEFCAGPRPGNVEDGKLRERQRVDGGEGVGVAANGAVEGVLREPGSPRLVKPLFERAALVGPVLVVIAGGDDGADSGEMRRMADGGEHLRGSDVRSAKHADFAVGVG